MDWCCSPYKNTIYTYLGGLDMLGLDAHLVLRLNVTRKKYWEHSLIHILQACESEQKYALTFVVPPSVSGGERFNCLTWKDWKAAGRRLCKESDISDTFFQGSMILSSKNLTAGELGVVVVLNTSSWGSGDTVHASSCTILPLLSKHHKDVMFYLLKNGFI